MHTYIHTYLILRWENSYYSPYTSLWKPDVSLPTDMDETFSLKLEHIAPQIIVQDDRKFHIQTRAQSQTNINTPDDRGFTFEQIRNAVYI